MNLLGLLSHQVKHFIRDMDPVYPQLLDMGRRGAGQGREPL